MCIPATIALAYTYSVTYVPDMTCYMAWREFDVDAYSGAIACEHVKWRRFEDMTVRPMLVGRQTMRLSFFN